MKIICLLAGTVLVAALNLRADEPLIIHEWGTFTCLQDENGQAIGGINVDDEPVPDFVSDSGGVHSLGGGESRTYDFGLPPYPRSKGWVPGDQDVTMRLETPVIYIYPPKGQMPASVPPLQVHVDFHGGVLSQYYPYADRAGFPQTFLQDDPLDVKAWNQSHDIGKLTTSLTWKDVRLGTDLAPVKTADKVWITPRETSAPILSVASQIYDGNGGFKVDREAEHFLFYRGVGHLDSPVSYLAGEDRGKSLSPLSDFPDSWLVDIRADGICAFSFHHLTRKRVPFGQDDYNSAKLTELKLSMLNALVNVGLFPDEASAMLRTWELSYFKSPGLRFFYIVPRKWVDEALPLKVTGAPAQITRVMVGRIELISQSQRDTLSKLASGPYPDLAALKQTASEAIEKSKLSKGDRDAYYRGIKPLTDLGISISEPVKDYLSLGRFRDALIVHQQSVQPADNLARFIRENGLAAAR